MVCLLKVLRFVLCRKGCLLYTSNADDFKKTLSEKGFDEYHVDGAEFKKDAMEMYKTNSDIIKEFNLSAN